MKSLYVFLFFTFTPLYATANETALQDPNTALKGYSNTHTLFLEAPFCVFSKHFSGTKAEHNEFQETCITPPIYPHNPRYLNETLKYTEDVFPAVLKGAQKVLESHKHVKYGAMAGLTGSVFNLMKKTYHSSISDNTTALIDALNDICLTEMLPALPDITLLGANALLFHGVQSSPSDYSRIAYSTLRVASALSASSTNLKNQTTPENLCSPEGFEFVRQMSLLASGVAYLALSHFQAYTAISALVAYRALNHIYMFGNEWLSQEQFEMTNSLIQNFILTSLLTTQVYAYFYPPNFPHLASILLATEYILAASFAYNR
jgi:hypothetical protein